MRKYYEAMLEHFREMHAEVLKALDALPPEALDWSPGPEMNSLTVLVMHIAGSERYWVGDVVKGTRCCRGWSPLPCTSAISKSSSSSGSRRQRVAKLDRSGIWVACLH